MPHDVSIILHGLDESDAQRFGDAARRRTTRSLEVHVVPDRRAETPGRARNAALGATDGRYVVFHSSAEPKSSFLEHALRTLEREPSMAFVGSWLDGVPQIGDRPRRPLAAPDLLSRPWFAHTPTLFRRELVATLGGFDEQLPGLEDFDFWLRALSSGALGCVIEEPALSGQPWGNSLRHDAPEARAVAEAVFERHRALFAQHWAEVIVGKERIIRELFLLRTAVEHRAIALRLEERRLSELLARVDPET